MPAVILQTVFAVPAPSLITTTGEEMEEPFFFSKLHGKQAHDVTLLEQITVKKCFIGFFFLDKYKVLYRFKNVAMGKETKECRTVQVFVSPTNVTAFCPGYAALLIQARGIFSVGSSQGRDSPDTSS